MQNDIWLNPVFAALWQDGDVFAEANALRGEVFRELEQRQTLSFRVQGREYFIKRHRGASWRDIVKNLVYLRLPVLSARNEYRAILRLQALGIRVPVLAAYGRRGVLPNGLESFIVTEGVGTHQSLEDYCRPWREQPPAFGEKLALLQHLADISRTMHQANICHRDYYLCHFLRLEDSGDLVLIDLHRALVKTTLRQRWVIKDIAGLYFSAMDIGLTSRDLYRFAMRYRQKPLRRLLTEDAAFLAQVQWRAQRVYRRHHA